MNAPAVQYVTTSDGVSIAYATSGEGYPLVFMPSQFSHIEIYWTQKTFMFPWLQGLAARFRLVQYDSRGQGMSQRGLSERLTLANLSRDLEAVVERLGLDRFHLMASQWAVHTAVQYAVEHPKQVSALLLASGTVNGRELPMVISEEAASRDWDGFLLSQLPVGRATDVRDALARMKQAINPEDWFKLVRAIAESDLSALLPRLQTPTLIMHPRDLFRLETSMKLAGAMPDGRMVHVDGTPPFGDASHGLGLIEAFLAGLAPSNETSSGAPGVATGAAGLSARELEVLHLVATGKSNQQIADELVISLNTVNRHVSNIYAKTGAANRAEAVGYAHRHGLAN
jgi:DNA-binding CsgD family transcriptional regulator